MAVLAQQAWELERVYKRFSRWCDKGIWERMMQHFTEDPDMENLLVESTIVRAHPCAAGAPKKNGGQESQALGAQPGWFQHQNPHKH